MDIRKQKKIFGTDGIRGHANRYPMSAEVVLALGKALGRVLKARDPHSRVVIGKDTRLSCYLFENALIAGLCAMGVDTLMVGPLPTPGVAYITRAYRASAGIVISASHNPYYDNGIKVFNSEGFKISDEIEAQMEDAIISNDFSENFVQDAELGRNTRIADADGRYIEFVKASFPKGKTLSDMKIFLDCANGAAHRVAPAAFWELEAQVIVTGNQPNGININDQCGSLHPQVTQKGVIENQADVGIALDGDADRVIMVDEKGQIVDGDIILAICALQLKQTGQLNKNAVVATVMTNYGVLKFLESHGIEVFLSPVGDRYVIQEMVKQGLNLGGEQSGHLLFLDHSTTGDGLITALQVLKIMQQRDCTLSELVSIVQKCPQALVNVKVKRKPALKELVQTQKVIDQAEKELGDMGRVLVRYSGTEPLCRVMVEGPQKGLVTQLSQKIAATIEQEVGK